MSLQRRVGERAGDRCEYCRLPQDGQEATFHVDHVAPVRAGGPTVFENLALACVSCSHRRGARSLAPDPASGAPVPIFDPRRDDWREHFALRDGLIESALPTGRATIAALALNRPIAVAIRLELIAIDRYDRCAAGHPARWVAGHDDAVDACRLRTGGGDLERRTELRG